MKAVFTLETQDMITGEVVKRQLYRKETANAEQFARVFFSDIALLASCSGAEKGVVLACLQFLDYNTNEFILTPDRRDAICLCADIKLPTATAAITQLRKQNILIKKRGSTYILNPNILFYGDEKERKKVIDATTEYKLGGGMQGKNPLAKTKQKK